MKPDSQQSKKVNKYTKSLDISLKKNVPKRDDSILSVTLLVLAGFVSIQPTLHLMLLSGAFWHYYKYVIVSPIPDALSSVPLLIDVAFYVYLFTFPAVITFTVISLRKKRTIFWLPLAYLILNIFLFFFLQGQPYWEGYVI